MTNLKNTGFMNRLGAFLALTLTVMSGTAFAENFVAVRMYGSPEIARDPSGRCTMYTQMVLDTRAHTVTTFGPMLTETSTCRIATNPKYLQATIESSSQDGCGSTNYTLAKHVRVGADDQRLTFGLVDHSGRTCENVIPSRFVLETLDGHTLYGNR